MTIIISKNGTNKKGSRYFLNGFSNKMIKEIIKIKKSKGILFPERINANVNKLTKKAIKIYFV